MPAAFSSLAVVSCFGDWLSLCTAVWGSFTHISWVQFTGRELSAHPSMCWYPGSITEQALHHLQPAHSQTGLSWAEGRNPPTRGWGVLQGFGSPWEQGQVSPHPTWPCPGEVGVAAASGCAWPHGGTFPGQVHGCCRHRPGTHPPSFQPYSGGGKVPAQTSIASQDSPQQIVEKLLLQKVQLRCFVSQQVVSSCTFIYQQ